MSLSGPQIFQRAVGFEIFANLASLPLVFFAPDVALSYLLEDASNITPGYRKATTWFGVLVALVTVPLVKAYPRPAPGTSGKAQRKHRFATYIVLGGSEVVIAALSVLLPWYKIDTGFSETGLRSVFAAMSAFIAMRAFFLVGRPDWMEDRRDVRKRE